MKGDSGPPGRMGSPGKTVRNTNINSVYIATLTFIKMVAVLFLCRVLKERKE